MNEEKLIHFGFARINTDEFAILSESFDLAKNATMNANMTFGFNLLEKILAMQVKFTLLQEDKILAVISVTCQFRIVTENWTKLYLEESNKLTIPKAAALHFASLTVGTARGVLHSKTENHPINSLIIPPINVNDFIKADLVLAGPQFAPTQ